MINDNLIYGKLLPQSIEVEEAVIGTMMIERDCFINNPVKSEWFYKENHQKIILCINELVNESIPIDLIQVTKRLKDKGQLEEIGGPLYITQLTSQIASAAHIGYHIDIIKGDFVRRELIRISSEINNKCYDQSIPIDDLFTSLQAELSNTMSFGTDSSVTYEQATEELILSLDSNIEVGTKTGLSKFDKFSGGLHDSDLIIIAGETSQGKTSLAVSILKNCAKNGSKSAVFSLEMTNKQLVSRITAQESGISAKKIMYNNLSNDEKSYVIKELDRLKNLPIYFDENSTNDIDKICTSIRKLRIKYGIELVLVDYIQDMKGSDTEAGIADIGRKLKNIAKELNIPIIAISQLARDKFKPEPTISRLRGSGQLEEKADVIMLLYRPEYYDRKFPEPFDDEPTAGNAMVTIAKGRNIGLASFLLKFNNQTTNFYDYEVPEEYEFQSSASPKMPTGNFYEKDAPF